MVISQDIVYIIEQLVNSMNNTFEIDQIVDNGDGTFDLIMCNTGYIVAKTEVSIDVSNYKVVSITQNEKIVIEGVLDSTPDPVGTEVKAQNPIFFNGTIISTKKELDSSEDWRDKYPLVYLYEAYREGHDRDKMSRIAYETRLRLFFMEATDPQNYTNSEQYSEVLRPVRSLVDDFVALVENSTDKFAKLTKTVEYVPWINFGKFVSDKGNTEKLFSDDLSGYELVIHVPVTTDYLDRIKCENEKNC